MNLRLHGKQRIPAMIVRLVMTVQKSCVIMMLQGRTGEDYTLSRGVRWGDALAATVFNLQNNSHCRILPRLHHQLLWFIYWVSIFSHHCPALFSNKWNKTMGLKFNEMKINESDSKIMELPSERFTVSRSSKFNFLF